MEPNTIKIFLADKEPCWLELYARYLANLGYTHVQYFSKSSECLDQLTLKPDLIFLDYNMDNLNGIDILKKIKRFDPNILVVFISGRPEINIAVNALKYGALDYFAKENIDENRIRICLEKVEQIRDIFLARQKPGIVRKLFTGVRLFSVFFFFQRLAPKI
jgi:DNA-binding NtrC family response regulator